LHDGANYSFWWFKAIAILQVKGQMIGPLAQIFVTNVVRIVLFISLLS